MKYRDSCYYHVYNRGSRKGNIFFSKENYDYFLRLVKANSNKYSTSIIACCLMPNHYHLLLFQREGGSISKTLQTTLNSYVQAVNKRYKFSGSLFQGKVKSILVERDKYLVHLVRYIHLNPVKAKLALSPIQWEYSDYSRWVENGKPSDSLKLSDGFIGLRNSYFGGGNNYREFVEGYDYKAVGTFTKYFLE
ncbi:MAG: transposase [Bacteroidota bacterium]